MEFLKVLVLRGPNIWAYFPVIEAWVDLGDLNDCSSDEVPGLNRRLMDWLPGMIEHRCSVGERGGFFERLRRGTYPAHILEHVTIELQTLAGCPTGYGRARASSIERVYKVVFRYKDETLARACLAAARELVLAAIHDLPFDLATTLAHLRRVASTHLLSPGADAVVQAARARNIPFLRLDGADLVQLGTGARQRRVRAAETDRTGAIATSIAQDHELARTLLHAAAIPIQQRRAGANEYRLLVVGDRLKAATRISNGEAAADVTNLVHPATAEHAILAARIVGLDVAGVDIIAGDIAAPLETQDGGIIELHPAPDLRLHLDPPGAAIVDLLFAPGDTGRIPIAAISGVTGTAPVARLLARLLRQPCLRTGLATTDGVYVDDLRILDGDDAGPAGARALLMHPLVDLAVLQTSRSGILTGGLAFNECAVAVVTSIGDGDPSGVDDLNGAGDTARVLGGIVDLVSTNGAAVLNAADPWAAGLATQCPGAVIYFSLRTADPVIAAHLTNGGRAAFVHDGWIVLATGPTETRLAPAGTLACTPECALAAAAAAWAMDVAPATIAERLLA